MHVIHFSYNQKCLYKVSSINYPIYHPNKQNNLDKPQIKNIILLDTFIICVIAYHLV